MNKIRLAGCCTVESSVVIAIIELFLEFKSSLCQSCYLGCFLTDNKSNGVAH